MAANPQKEYIGDDNKPRKVSVIDCLNQNSSNKDNEDIRIVEPAKEHYESYVKACQQMHAYLTDESINDPVGKRESAGFIFAQDKYQVSSQEDFKNKIVDFFKNKRKLNTSVHNQELNREKGPELFYFITKGNEIIGSINARPIKMDEFDRKNGIKSCEKWHELSPETGVRATTSTVILHQHKNKGYAGKAKEQLFNNLNKYGITEVVANVMADNIRSNKAQEKLVNKYGGFSSVCRDGELCGSRYVVSTDTSGNSKKLYKKREKPPQEKMRSGLRQTLKKAAKAASNSLPIFKVKQNNSKG